LNQIKVFEFAKEIGIETISLMDKIREWKLPIKNHMATLDDEMISTIKGRLEEEIAAKSDKKKTAKSAGSTKKAAMKKTSEGAVAAPVVTKVSAKATEESTQKSEGAVSESAPAPKKVAVKKTAAKTTSKTEAASKKVASAAAVPAAPVEKKSQGIIRRKAGDIAAAQQAAAEAEALAAQQAQEREASGEAAECATQDSSEVSASAPFGGAAEVSSVTTSATTTSTEPVKRRNIVGRMDLSRARPPAGVSVSPSGDGRGPRPSGVVAARSNIRTGFFATPVVDPDALQPNFEEEERNKREEKKKRPAAPKEEEVQTFNAADFRKREVIFQPKKKKVALKGEIRKTQITTPKASKRVIKVEKSMTVSNLAQAMGIKAPALIKKLMTDGVMANLNTALDYDTIALVAPEFGFEAENVHRTAEQLLEAAAFGQLEAAPITRAPVVTVMGHVDHGKTSLLDTIRKANVAAKEAGGITQHIGAYKVRLDNGKEITFLDTPGHEAFTHMRARGANVTDVAIIVVAADDGVMPQTAEAINHAKAAEVPIIIAVNKIDKPGVNVDKIKQQLTEYEIVPEEWGGSNIFCEVSATKKIGIQELLEQILLVTEVEDLKANPKRSGTGVVIESRLEKGRGPVATLLVKDGTVRVGDDIVVGKVSGRVRAMMNDRGEQVKEALPSDPVEIIGLSEAAQAGDRFDIVKDEEEARAIALARKAELEKPVATGKEAISLEDLFAKVQKGQILELNVVLKADVSGSLEALRGMLDKASTSEVKVKIIHSQVGGISESDVLLAATSGGLILGFNVRPDTTAMRLAKERNVEIKTYSIIYELLDDVKKAMTGLLKPTLKEVVNGRAEVREVFSVPKIGNIAGCFVSDGKIARSDQCRLLREGKIIYTGKFGSLKRFKDDVKEVATGFECGIGIENFNDIKTGDTIEAFHIIEIAKQL
jgi:translation initiation factor IF-2